MMQGSVLSRTVQNGIFDMRRNCTPTTGDWTAWEKREARSKQATLSNLSRRPFPPVVGVEKL
eukprot:scaffold3604_cov100-Skeletonema_marinoi.AAC.2